MFTWPGQLSGLHGGHGEHVRDSEKQSGAWDAVLSSVNGIDILKGLRILNMG